MRRIFYVLFAVLMLGMVFTACSEDELLSTATETDDPRILDPIFPDRVNGELPVVANISRDANFTMTLTVTPADYTTVVWQIDGEEVQTGLSIDMPLKAGNYHMKVIVTTTQGKSTYREGIIQVNPLQDDPWVDKKNFERIIAPASKACLYGNNLNKVKSIIIDGTTIADITYVESAEGNYIEYVVPESLSEGVYRLILVDEGGNEYGGDTVTVTRSSLITSGADRTSSGFRWTMTGVNLDQVVSFTLGGQTISDFESQSATEIVLTCPYLEDGEYLLTGTTQSGEAVSFYTVEGNQSELATVVSSEMVLWEGHHYVSWDLADDDPHKTFNLLDSSSFASVKAGSTLRIYYSVEQADEYHQLRTTTGYWNDLVGTAVIEFSEDGVKEVVLTQEVLNQISSEDGFLCVGHGYYVDRITVQ